MKYVKNSCRSSRRDKHVENNYTEPVKRGSCKLCITSDNIEIVQCDSCDSWYHFNYVNLTADIANQPWVCETCCALHTSNSASGVNKCEPPSFYKRSQIQVKPTLQ